MVFGVFKLELFLTLYADPPSFSTEQPEIQDF